MQDCHALYAARLRAEPGRARAIFHEFAAAFRADVGRRRPSRGLPAHFAERPGPSPAEALRELVRAEAEAAVLESLDAIRGAADAL